MNTEKIELFGDAKFVLNACRNTFDLHAVTQRRVENFDEFTVIDDRLRHDFYLTNSHHCL